MKIEASGEFGVFFINKFDNLRFSNSSAIVYEWEDMTIDEISVMVRQ